MLEHVRGKPLQTTDRKVIGSYPLGYLRGELDTAATGLMLYFVRRETFLPESFNKFLGLQRLEPAKVYEAAGVCNEPSRQLECLLKGYRHSRLAPV